MDTYCQTFYILYNIINNYTLHVEYIRIRLYIIILEYYIAAPFYSNSSLSNGTPNSFTLFPPHSSSVFHLVPALRTFDFSSMFFHKVISLNNPYIFQFQSLFQLFPNFSQLGVESGHFLLFISF